MRRTARVTDFDEAVGLGSIAADDGTLFVFHCIEIADGTRTIDVGQAVTFEPLPRFGSYQAGVDRQGGDRRRAGDPSLIRERRILDVMMALATGRGRDLRRHRRRRRLSQAVAAGRAHPGDDRGRRARGGGWSTRRGGSCLGTSASRRRCCARKTCRPQGSREIGAARSLEPSLKALARRGQAEQLTCANLLGPVARAAGDN